MLWPTGLVVSAFVVAVVGHDEYGTVVGIDLGTTYSCVGVFKHGRVEIIPNDQGNRITPSYVAFTQEGERLIGDAAKNQLTSNPKNTVFDVKRLMGREWTEKCVQDDIKKLPFMVTARDNKPHILVDSPKGQQKKFAPEEISGMILGKMRDVAQTYLGKRVTHAVVTVPAYFNDAQRQATKDAGVIAGLTILRIINEPTAAAIAYGLDQTGSERDIMVFDLGGGTFDVSLLTIDEGVFEVVATSGDTHLGGEDFDQRVMDYFINMYEKKKGKDIRKDPRAVQKLRREVEKAKRALSSTQQVKLEIESFFDGFEFSETLTRAKFEELNLDLFKSTLEPLKKVLEDADLDASDIEDIVLVGGSTRIPKIQELVKEFFGGKEPSRNINPDEAVAFGAAVQAGVLAGEDDTEIVLVDVNPLSLGVETDDVIMTVVIPRNTVVPVKKSRTFTSVIDSQETITFKIFEGERPLTKDNHLLGRFDLTGIPPAPRGVPQIEVTFEVDVSGILQVSAVDQKTGQREGLTITSDAMRLKDDEIKRMIKDAERYAEEDEKLKDLVEARSDLESYIYKTKNMLSEDGSLGSKLSPEEISSVEDTLKEKIQWLEKNYQAGREAYVNVKRELENIIQPLIVRTKYGGSDKTEL